MTKAKLMGILNVTPDSFFDQGKYFGLEKSIERALELAKQGADIIDIGGESTRPGSIPISEEEEIDRVIPLIQELHAQLSIPISIDTSKPKVAALALKAGATFINDVTGAEHIEMQDLVATTGVSICIMHMKGNPLTMQENTEYPERIIPYLLRWFEERLEILFKKGIKKEQIVLDPGIGFGKTVAHNVEIIENLPQLKELDFPILIGLSRKSFMGKLLQKNTADILPATLMMNGLALMNGADIIRVHDIEEHRQILDLLNILKQDHNTTK